jgi:GTPase SAR1 family protein
MISIKKNDKPNLPKCEMNCDSELHEKLNKYDLTSFLNSHSMNLLIGKPKSGKTSLLHSMFEHKGLLRYIYDKVYLFQPVHSGASIKDCIFDTLPLDQVYRELTYENLNEVKQRIEQDSEEGLNSTIVFDDVTSELKNKSTMQLFKQLAFNRRHLHLSMYFLVQTWYSVPKELRRLWTNMFIFKVSKNELTNIWDEIIEHEIEYLPNIMKTVYNEPYKFLFINTDSQRMFDGFDEVIFDDDDDDS